MLTVFPRDNCNDLFSAWLCEISSFRFGYGLYLVFVFYLSNKRTLKSNKSIDDSKLHQQTKNTKNHPKCTLQLQEIISQLSFICTFFAPQGSRLGVLFSLQGCENFAHTEIRTIYRVSDAKCQFYEFVKKLEIQKTTVYNWIIKL